MSELTTRLAEITRLLNALDNRIGDNPATDTLPMILGMGSPHNNMAIMSNPLNLRSEADSRVREFIRKELTDEHRGIVSELGTLIKE